jgi:hypothetical protein
MKLIFKEDSKVLRENLNSNMTTPHSLPSELSTETTPVELIQVKLEPSSEQMDIMHKKWNLLLSLEELTLMVMLLLTTVSLLSLSEEAPAEVAVVQQLDPQLELHLPTEPEEEEEQPPH